MVSSTSLSQVLTIKNACRAIDAAYKASIEITPSVVYQWGLCKIIIIISSSSIIIICSICTTVICVLKWHVQLCQ